jgi:hypothetical protein
MKGRRKKINLFWGWEPVGDSHNTYVHITMYPPYSYYMLIKSLKMKKEYCLLTGMDLRKGWKKG